MAKDMIKKGLESLGALIAFYLNSDVEVTNLIDRIGILTQRMYEIKVKLQNPKLSKLQKLIYIIKLKKIENKLNSILNGR